jgi:hypothetical protein
VWEVSTIKELHLTYSCDVTLHCINRQACVQGTDTLEHLMSEVFVFVNATLGLFLFKSWMPVDIVT